MKAGWKTSKLGEVSSFLNRGISPKYLDAGGICVLNQKCVRDHRISYEPSRRHDEQAKRVGGDRLLQAGDVLVNSTGTGTLGRVAQLRDDPPEPTTVDSHVTIVRPIPGKFYPEFFGYMMVVIEDAIKDSGEGCGGQTELARSVLVDKFLVHYPESLHDQQRIVGILDEAFDGIATAKANAEKNLQNAKDIYASVLESMYTDFGESYSTEELGTYIETLTDYHANGSYEVLKQNVDLKDTEDYAWMVRSTDFENNFFNSKRFISKQAYEFLTKSRIFGGELIMSKIGNAGKVYLMPDISSPCSLAMNLFLIRLNEKKVTHKYIYHYLKTCGGKAQIQSRLKGVATQTITKDNVRSLQIPICSHDKQVLIVSSLEEVSVEIQRLESIYQQKLAALDALKKSLLDQAFNGRI